MIALDLPWGVLTHDNHRLSPRKHGKGLFQTSRYRNAKEAAKLFLRAQYDGAPMEGPLELVAVFHVPDNVRRDVTNFAKCICDALTGTVIEDDRWQVLRKTTWEVEGIDRDNPRVNLYLAPVSRP
jgi:Holliday junction resolvase RusA-like endonuclease